jgi:hypothetical protein
MKFIVFGIESRGNLIMSLGNKFESVESKGLWNRAKGFPTGEG